MLNLIFFVLLLLALVGILIIIKSNRKQEDLIKKETESIERLQNKKSDAA